MAQLPAINRLPGRVRSVSSGTIAERLSHAEAYGEALEGLNDYLFVILPTLGVRLPSLNRLCHRLGPRLPVNGLNLGP